MCHNEARAIILTFYSSCCKATEQNTLQTFITSWIWKHTPIKAQLSTIDNTSSLQILLMLSGYPFSGSTKWIKEEIVKLQFWEN
jgi:hypothetical protein